ncbi:MAG: molybdenum cofactor guanylyltransferase MobA [Proteobacteria bacterium]|nr:molybdenum cofactor guanylyltransferase MobA [Pseudomonadota bacterium]
MILAGGRGRRMGGAAKALLPLAGQPLLAHVVQRLAGQVRLVAVSANDAAVAIAAAPLPVVGDAHDDRRGPLAGLLAGMEWCRAQHPDVARIVSVPVDCPFLPHDLVAQLADMARETDAEVVVAASRGGEHHPTVALWRLSLAGPLRDVVESGADLSVRRFYRARHVAVCSYESAATDPFFNINTPADLAWAENALRMGEDLEAVVAGDADEGHADGLGLPHREQGGR